MNLLLLSAFYHSLALVAGVLQTTAPILTAVTGDATFAKEFCARYIYDSELPDYETLLALAGFELRLVDEKKLDLVPKP